MGFRNLTCGTNPHPHPHPHPHPNPNPNPHPNPIPNPNQVILFGYLALLVLAMMAAGWKLYPKVGYVLILLDLFFVAWSLLTNPIGSSAAVIDVSSS